MIGVYVQYAPSPVALTYKSSFTQALYFYSYVSPNTAQLGDVQQFQIIQLGLTFSAQLHFNIGA